MRALDPYMSFRFGFYLPEAKKHIGLSSIYSDPFSDSLWLAKAHWKETDTLAKTLEGVSKGQILFFDKGMTDIARSIEVEWKSTRWAPADLDATENTVAIERLVLVDVFYDTETLVNVVDLKGEEVC